LAGNLRTARAQAPRADPRRARLGEEEDLTAESAKSAKKNKLCELSVLRAEAKQARHEPQRSRRPQRKRLSAISAVKRRSERARVLSGRRRSPAPMTARSRARVCLPRSAPAVPTIRRGNQSASCRVRTRTAAASTRTDPARPRGTL